MTTISASVIADSMNTAQNANVRLSTLQVTYPRWIHAEGRTHRLLSLSEDEFEGWDWDWEPRTPSLMEDRNLSRNAASSRAIPVKRMIEAIRLDPAVPLYWGKNQKGMQADEEISEPIIFRDNMGLDLEPVDNETAWIECMEDAIARAEAFDRAGYHKQIVNRLLEPFMHITVVVSSTEWTNFFKLRNHRDAEPHIHLLAAAMLDALDKSVPVQMQAGNWHLPYVTDQERHLINFDEARLLSSARLASVSYNTVEGFEMDIGTAKRICNKLFSDPMHASPFEHVAQADFLTWQGWGNPKEHGNFVGWCQFRKMLEGNTKHVPLE